MKLKRRRGGKEKKRKEEGEMLTEGKKREDQEHVSRLQIYGESGPAEHGTGNRGLTTTTTTTTTWMMMMRIPPLID